MLVHVLFFAGARDAAGCRAADLAIPDGSTVRDVRDALGVRFPALRDRLSHARFAVDLEFADLDRSLHEGAEVAVVPPVSGG